MYTLFLIRRGLDFRGVALVDGFYMVSTALLDYPTGGLADRYGRGLVASLGCVFMGAGLLAYSASGSLPQFLVSDSWGPWARPSTAGPSWPGSSTP